MIEITRICSRCNLEKPTDSFTRNKTKKFGLDSCCKLCKSREDKEYRRLNTHKLKEYFKEYHLLNKEYKVRVACKWQKDNKEQANSNKSANRAKRIKRFPSWLTLDQLNDIKSFYKKAEELTKSTGILHHVDHIVPLNGKLVSGLHVPSNLQVIPWNENLSKNNKFVI